MGWIQKQKNRLKEIKELSGVYRDGSAQAVGPGVFAVFDDYRKHSRWIFFGLMIIFLWKDLYWHLLLTAGFFHLHLMFNTNYWSIKTLQKIVERIAEDQGTDIEEFKE